jgi:hypothetical protein
MWEAATADCGAFVRLDEARAYTRPYSVYSYSTVFCEFEKNGVAVTALFGEGEQLVSLLMNYYSPLSKLTYETESSAKPLLWKVTAPEGGSEMYLMGSMHAADASLYGLPRAVMGAFDYCDALALEYDVVDAALDFNLYLQAQMELTYQDGPKITDHISRETYDKAVACLRSRGRTAPCMTIFRLRAGAAWWIRRSTSFWGLTRPTGWTFISRAWPTLQARRFFPSKASGSSSIC